MLRKVIATICIVAILATVLSGCGFIFKNEQRDAGQTIAKVSYGGRVAYVTKGELANSFNQQGVLYMQYYGWTAEKTFEQLTKSLATSALMKLKAKDYLSNHKDIKDKLTSSTVGIEFPTNRQLIEEMEQLLTEKDIMEARQATNDTFWEAYNELYKQIEEEIRLSNPPKDEDEEEDEEVTDEEEDEFIRPNPPEEDEVVEEIVIPDDFFVIIEDEIEKGDTIGRDALRRLKRNLSKQYRDYDYFYKGQLEAKVVERYKEVYKSELDEPTTQEIDARYYEIFAKNINSFAREGAYKSALEANPKGIIYHPGYDIESESGYFFVKNILLSFSDEQEAELKAFIDSKVANDEAIKAYRASLAEKILVNVSNPKYDKELGNTEDNPKFDREKVPVGDILEEIEKDLNDAKTLSEIIQVFIDWTYLVNDDPGMFTVLEEDKPDYLVTPEGMASSYVEEFTELARELFARGEGAYGIGDNELSYCVTDYGIHLILVTRIPFDYANKKGGDEIAVTADGKNVYTLDAVIDVMTGETLREYLFDILVDEKTENAITVSNNKFYEENKDTAIEFFPKVYKDIFKQAKEVEELLQKR